MSFSITQAFVQQFKSNVTHLAQQKGSRLMNTLRIEQTVGDRVYFERLAASAAIRRTTRHADTPLVDVDHSRRAAFPEDYDWADLIDNLDKLKFIISPQSEYAINGANALGRTKDEVIIAAFNAAAASGVDGSSTTALPASQQIAHGSADLTLAKIIQAQKILDAANVDTNDRFFVYGSNQKEALLNTTTITSSDFNTIKALVRGEIDTYLGFKFIQSELLPVASSIRLNFAYQKKAMGLALGKDITARITERDDKNFATQVYLSLSVGAVRIDDSGVVEISNDESA